MESKHSLMHSKLSFQYSLIPYLAIIILLLNSCSDTARDSIDSDCFEVFFYQGLNNNMEGPYEHRNWKHDWNSPSWQNGLDRTEIEFLQNDPALRFNFPEGSLGPKEGGGQWLSHFESNIEEVYFSWNLMFKPGFQWCLGGKLPGLGGGSNPGGGKTVNWDDGFSCRIMWDRERSEDGKLFLYVYHQDKKGQYGDVWGFKDDILLSVRDSVWYNITLRLSLNTVEKNKLESDPENAGNKDGLLECFVDGRLVFSKSGIRWRNLASIWVDTMHITSFFGGSSDEWRNERHEWLLLDDFIVFQYKTGGDSPGIRIPSSPDRILELPASKATHSY